jgi:hypothetical protein
LANVPFDRAEVTVHSLSSTRTFKRVFDKSNPSITAVRRRLRMPDGTIVQGAAETAQAWTTDPPDVPKSGGWPHTYLPTTRLFGTLSPSRYFLGSGAVTEDVALEQQIDSQFTELFERLWTRYYTDISQKVQTAQERGLASLLNQILSGPQLPHKASSETDFDTLFDRVSRFMQRQPGHPSLGARDEFKRRYEQNMQLQSVVDDLNTVESQVERAMAPRTKLQALINRLFTNKRISLVNGRVGITMPDDTTIPLSSLSSGEKQILRLLIETLSDHQNSTIIDEPELSLHVDWQHELVADLRDLKPSSQLIIATHSPEIMARVPDDNIFRL